MKILAAFSKARPLFLLMPLALAGCSGGAEPFCGDGNLDPGEQCDDMNSDDTDFCLSTCRARQLTSLTVKWEFNKDEAVGFTGDSCIDLRASRVQVELVGGAEPVILSESCSFRQVVFQDVAPGSYTLKLSVLDFDGEAITKAPIEQEYMFAGGSAMTEIEVAPTAWSRTFSGTFFFRLAWGGLDCDVGVANERLTLAVGGEVFSGTTTDGVPMNGTGMGVCQSLSEEFPQSALEVPFGPATFTVEGLDSEGAVQYETVFETFVGAGVNNPELQFDVDSVASDPDAGVPDAGLPDAS